MKRETTAPPPFRARSAALAAAAGLAFFAVGLPLLDVPGMPFDEAISTYHAAAWITPPVERGPAVRLMYDTHQASLKTWPMLAVFELFGISARTLRATGLGLGAASVFLLVLFVARRRGDEWAALVAPALATAPGAVLAVVFDTGLSAMGLLLRSAAVFLIGEGLLRRDRRAWLLAGAAAAGIGVWNKANFLWLPLAAVPAALLAAWLSRSRRDEQPGLRDADAAALLAGFAVGAAPILYFNVVHPLATFAHPPAYTESLAAHWSRLGGWLCLRARMALEALDGRASYLAVSGRPAPFPWAAAVIPVAGLAALIALARRGERRALAEPAFWVLVMAGTVLIAGLAPMPVKPHHFPLLASLPELAAVALLAALFGASPRRGARAALWAGALIAAGGQLLFLRTFSSDVAATGGSSLYQSVAVDLAAWAQDYQGRHPGAMIVCGDWLDYPTLVLSGGRVVPRTLDGVSARGAEPRRAWEALADGRLVWLRRSPLSAEYDLHGLGGDDALAAFEREMPSEALAVFRDPSGRPWAEARRAAPVGIDEIARAWNRAVAPADDGSGLRALPPARTPSARPAPLAWVRVRGGEFTMGSESLGADSRPPHRVAVRDFLIAKTPVTAAQYDRCVRAGACRKPFCGALGDDYPVSCVDWRDAADFSRWAGGRLPSEAQWEFAARGRGEDDAYPDRAARASCAGVESCVRRPRPVCALPGARTAQGLCDMIGERWEWVEDAYHPSFDGAPADGRPWTDDPVSPITYHVGDLDYSARLARSAYRTYFDVADGSPLLGFRPARDAAPGGAP